MYKNFKYSELDGEKGDQREAVSYTHLDVYKRQVLTRQVLSSREAAATVCSYQDSSLT